MHDKSIKCVNFYDSINLINFKKIPTTPENAFAQRLRRRGMCVAAQKASANKRALPRSFRWLELAQGREKR